jgi:DNA helicase IV
VFRLSTNYRNSAEIYDLAAQVASVAVPDPDLADAVRRTGEHPEHHVVEASALPAEVVTRTEAMLAAVEGTVAVVTARADRESIADTLAVLLAEHPERLRVLEGLDTKGLEFDGVVVVEPDAITDESGSGWRTLYVALTRATQRLTTVATADRWRTTIA